MTQVFRDKCVYLPHATVIFSAKPNFTTIRRILSFYHSYVLLPRNLGVKMFDPVLTLVFNNCKSLLKSSVSYSHDLDERYTLFHPEIRWSTKLSTSSSIAQLESTLRCICLT